MRFDGRARAWVEEVVGGQVVRARRMPGGVSSAVHLVAVDRPAGRTAVVLRRTIDAADVPEQDPVEEARQEVAALTVLAGWELAPALIAAELTGARCGAPAVLTTRLPGRPWLVPGRHLEQWLDGLAEAVGVVNRQDVSRADLPPARDWVFGPPGPPPWTREPSAWTWAWSVAGAGLPRGGPDALVHRDLHPGNVLFSRRRLTGIVDWESMCRGPAELDVSRCRVQVGILAGVDAADGLLARCADLVPGYDARWDALVACELMPWTEDLLAFNRLGGRFTLAGIRAALDAVVVRAASGPSAGR